MTSTITPKTTKPKINTDFKIGSYVVCTEVPRNRDDGPIFVDAMEAAVGSPLKVIEYHSNWVKVEHLDGYDFFYLVDWIKSASKAAVAKGRKAWARKASAAEKVISKHRIERQKAKAKVEAAAEKLEAARQTARATRLRTLSTDAARIVAMFDKNKDAFGCQREHVVAHVEAIIGQPLADVINT